MKTYQRTKRSALIDRGGRIEAQEVDWRIGVHGKRGAGSKRPNDFVCGLAVLRERARGRCGRGWECSLKGPEAVGGTGQSQQ